MSRSYSRELESVLEQATTLAFQHGQPLSSAYMVLAIVSVPNQTARYLNDQLLTSERVLRAMSEVGPEPAGMFERLRVRAERMADSGSSSSVTSLHLTNAILRDTSCQANRVLEATLANFGAFKAMVAHELTIQSGSRRPGLAAEPAEVPVEQSRRRSQQAGQSRGPRAIGFHPSLGVEATSKPAAAPRTRPMEAVAPSAAPAAPQPPAATPAGESAPNHENAWLTRPPSPRVLAQPPEAPNASPAAREATPTGSFSSILRTPSPTSSPAFVPRSITPAAGIPAIAPADPASQTPPNPKTPASKPAPATGMPRTTTPSARPFAKRDSATESEASQQTAETPAPAPPRAPLAPAEPRKTEPAAPRNARPATPQAPEAAPADPAPASERSDTDAAQEALEEARRTARRLADTLNARRKMARNLAEQLDQDAKATPSDADVKAPKADPADPPQAPESPTSESASPAPQPSLDAEPASLESVLNTRRMPDSRLAAKYELDAVDFPNLVKYGRNLTAEAALQLIDPVIGRDQETLQIIDILGKRRANNPLLVGEAGVGKTAIVEGLAHEFVQMAREGSRLGQRAIIELEMSRLLSGTHLRGALSERLTGIKDEVRRANGRVIVFLDEVHMWLSTGGGGDGADAAGELKTALARGTFPCIGATTHDEFRKFIENDPAFERRFQVVNVEEPDVDTTIAIVAGVQVHYEGHHGVTYEPEALEAAVRLSQRYIHDRQLPDKAIGVLDLAGSRAARTACQRVSREHIAHVVAEMAGLPADRLTQSDSERFLRMNEFLASNIIGHREIIDSICEVIRRNYAGFRSRRPIGSLLFLGPTGVGKTEMVKALADFLFHDPDAIVRLDMSEMMEAHSVSRVIGAPPGYVGFDQGGQLTEAIRRRPYQVVLLDEVEKAHPDVLNLLLQLFDEGRLTDGRGRQVDFSNTVIIMTSNLGASVFDDGSAARRGRIGFGEGGGEDAKRRDEAATRAVQEAARKHFTPELWNRIDERLVFLPLKREEVAQIAHLQLRDSARRLLAESNIELGFEEAVVDHLIENGGFDSKLGARPMRQAIQRLVEACVARHILSGDIQRGTKVMVDVQDGELVCLPGAEPAVTEAVLADDAETPASS